MEPLKRDEERELVSEEKIEQISLLGGGQITRKRRRKRRRKERGNSCGFLFSGIPQEVRISELKERLRETGARLTFLTWLGNKRAAKVFFQGERKQILSCIQDFRLAGELIAVTELLEKSEDGCEEILEQTESPESEKLEEPEAPVEQKVQVEEEEEEDIPAAPSLRSELEIVCKDEEEKELFLETAVPSYCDLIRDVQISADRRNFSNQFFQSEFDYTPSSYLNSFRHV